MLKTCIGLIMVMMTCYSTKTESVYNHYPAGNTDDSLEYIKQVRDFINHAPIETMRDPMNILADIPSELLGPRGDCLGEIKDDTAYFSKADLEYIFKESKKNRITVWPSDLSSRIKVISSDTINHIFDQRLRGWDYFYKNVGRSVNRFSPPIFFAGKYCLFYFGNSCGNLCGRGSLRLYVKEGDAWIVLGRYCRWIS